MVCRVPDVAVSARKKLILKREVCLYTWIVFLRSSLSLLYQYTDKNEMKNPADVSPGHMKQFGLRFKKGVTTSKFTRLSFTIILRYLTYIVEEVWCENIKNVKCSITLNVKRFLGRALSFIK